ncbi:MAG: Flp pilus assembly protein CpaB [Tepidisphaeraceae bacterium]
MTWKNSIPFVLALAFGLVAAKIGRDVFTRSHPATGIQTKLVNVVIAREDIEPGSVLSEQDLVMGQTPAENAPKPIFTAVSQVVGRVATVPLVRGLVIVEPMLAPAGTNGGAQALVPAGMRLVTVEVNEWSGVAGLVTPGTHVDVVSTLADDRINQPVTKTVVQNVKVIAVGQRLELPNSQGRKIEKAETAPGRSVTLLVTPRQAEVLEFVSSAARLRLTLRGSTDSAAVVSRTGVSVADLLDRASDVPEWFAAWVATSANTTPALFPTTRPADPPALVITPPSVKPTAPARVRTVEVINGGELTTVHYEQKGVGAGPVLSTTDDQKAIGGSHE